MLNKHYKSLFLLVTINIRKGFKMFFPVSLFVIVETLEALKDLAHMVEVFIPRNQYKLRFLLVSETIDACIDFIEGLRNYKKFRMVEVETPEAKVYIDMV